MARITHAAQIDLRFGDPAREFFYSGVGVWPGNFARERLHLFGKAGSEQTGRLNPWRSAFRAARARPRAVFGPVLARAFARLALILRSLVKCFFPCRRRLDLFKLGILDLLHVSSQCCAEDRPTPLDLVQGFLRRRSAIVVRRSIRSISSSFSTRASAIKESMLCCSVRNSWISVTAFGSRRTYSCTSSLALWARNRPEPAAV